RVALVEVFSGSTLEPGAAAGAVLQALDKTYKPTEVALLQYQIIVRQDGPLEPLSNPNSLERTRYYGKQLKAIPAVFIDGKLGPTVGGGLQAARAKYGDVREAINAELEKPAGAKIELTANRKDNEISVKATYSDVAKTGDTIRLRFVLADE